MIYKKDKNGKDRCQSHAYQTAAMYGRTCEQKLSNMGKYSELDRW